MIEIQGLRTELHLSETESKQVEDTLNFLSKSNHLYQLYFRSLNYLPKVLDYSGKTQVETLLSKKIEQIFTENLAKSDVVLSEKEMKECSHATAQGLMTLYVTGKLLMKAYPFPIISFNTWTMADMGATTTESFLRNATTAIVHYKQS
ncbi:MAG: hypothetical protein CMO81_00950 [Waddliaceae bacterium]|nr:hypothetical protein [Waddliaceae bacterium]